MKTIDRSEFAALIDELIASDPRDVVGVVTDGEQYVFDHLESADELVLDYDLTALSPKKYIMPQRETLLTYDRRGDDYEMRAEADPTGHIIVGVHPYDLAAINQLDKIFIDTLQDEPYRRKRENSVLIGVTMQDVAETCFAGSMDTATAESGYDLMVTDLGDRFAVDIGTFEGDRLLESVPTRNASAEEIDRVAEIEAALEDEFDRELTFPPAALPTLLEASYDDMDFWEDYAEQCLSCGTCNVVCPTCFCFSVDMIRDLEGDSGRQERRWDGCLLEDFATVAQGENFREEVAQRHRHRFMRKGWYIYERYGDIACVGCGRCTRHCVADVADPCEVYNELREAQYA
ncbi:Ni/Fe hydrogenase beta subunit [Halorhabdus utahensis DSM 12940]|uniref:Ni/Fe hydrogenase beta subunit n=1 Tax=Halorhabdus utahensis (strain DSM 12940 / JCM 11049 / AX-2) TaxID=519442 RepID=C7NPK9_HALUD|nr:4Fe-4S dicluster domain-containing protein [Halorhabdus utahensis]ACV12764.1 Ni/Fe hydrogenase beta subunit [Halorhabdus utahensis DSM 12940]